MRWCFCAGGVAIPEVTCNHVGNGNDANRPSDRENRLAQRKRKAEDNCMDPRADLTGSVGTPCEDEVPRPPTTEVDHDMHQLPQEQVAALLPRALAASFS